MLKKGFLLLLTLLFILPTMAFGEEASTLEFKDVGMRLEVPSNYKSITLDTPKDDPIFEEIGSAYEDIKTDFELNYFYLYTFEKDLQNLIRVEAIPFSYDGLLFENMDLAELQEKAKLIQEQSVVSGLISPVVEVYECDNATYIHSTYVENDAVATWDVDQYIRLSKTHYIVITRLSMNKSFTETDNEIMKDFIDSIEYIN